MMVSELTNTYGVVLNQLAHIGYLLRQSQEDLPDESIIMDCLPTNAARSTASDVARCLNDYIGALAEAKFRHAVLHRRLQNIALSML